jgi:hypothetical protein
MEIWTPPFCKKVASSELDNNSLHPLHPFEYQTQRGGAIGGVAAHNTAYVTVQRVIEGLTFFHRNPSAPFFIEAGDLSNSK